MQPPAGYERRVAGTATVIASPADAAFVERAVAAAGSLHGYAARQRDAVALPGRGTAYAIQAGADRWVVRHYQRGGAVAGWMGDRYLRGGATRPEAELAVSVAARGRGIPTPPVTAAVVYEAGAFYRGDLATMFIPNATDLAVLTLSARPWPDDVRRHAWRAAGELLRRCFDAGLIHPDLNLKNILVQRTTDGVSAYVIDLDRARLSRPATQLQRSYMLARFDRSCAKIEKKTGRRVAPDEQRALREGLAS